LLRLQGNQGVFDDARRHAVLERLNELPDFCLYSAQFALTGCHAGARRHPEAIHLTSEFMAELLEQVASEQLLLQCVQDSSLDFVSPDRQMIRARPFVASPEARQAMSRLENETTSAQTAFCEP
jgi:hypothetical protein